jgi:hypothetical protein
MSTRGNITLYQCLQGATYSFTNVYKGQHTPLPMSTNGYKKGEGCPIQIRHDARSDALGTPAEENYILCKNVPCPSVTESYSN